MQQLEADVVAQERQHSTLLSVLQTVGIVSYTLFGQLFIACPGVFLFSATHFILIPLFPLDAKSKKNTNKNEHYTPPVIFSTSACIMSHADRIADAGEEEEEGESKVREERERGVAE